MQLRLLGSADFEAIYLLDQVCFPSPIAYSRAALRYFVQRATYAMVAEIDGVLRAFLLASHALHQPEGYAHIITLDVSPEARRRGLARSLIEDAERCYRELGSAGLQLEVATDNETALCFYSRSGFIIRKRLAGYYNVGTDAFQMRKVF